MTTYLLCGRHTNWENTYIWPFGRNWNAQHFWMVVLCCGLPYMLLLLMQWLSNVLKCNCSQILFKFFSMKIDVCVVVVCKSVAHSEKSTFFHYSKMHFAFFILFGGYNLASNWTGDHLPLSSADERMNRMFINLYWLVYFCCILFTSSHVSIFPLN